MEVEPWDQTGEIIRTTGGGGDSPGAPNSSVKAGGWSQWVNMPGGPGDEMENISSF